MSAQAGLVRIKTSHDTVIVACPPMPSFSVYTFHREQVYMLESF